MEASQGCPTTILQTPEGCRVKHRFFFMAGLPRTGSTVLSAILSQNPKIHSGPASPVCPIMRDLTLGFSEGSFVEMSVANRPNFHSEVIGNVPHLYYKGVDKPFVIDKSRDWLHPRNMDLIRTYMSPTPQVLVLLRDKEAIIESFTNLWKKNGVPRGRMQALVEDATWKVSYYCDEIIPTVKAWQEITNGNSVHRGDSDYTSDQFLFIEYDQFVDDPAQTLAGIYKFFRLESYTHDFDNISADEIENDAVIGPEWSGLHQVRRSLVGVA